MNAITFADGAQAKHAALFQRLSAISGTLFAGQAIHFRDAGENTPPPPRARVIDLERGERPGIPTSESAELRAARRRIRELETELAIVRQAATFLGEDKPRPKGSTR